MKYAVIFKAEINQFDDEYSQMAAKMRDLAITEYGCTEFVATAEGNQEIAISYWDSLEHIKDWKQNAEHLVAQKLGQNKWYKHYTVEVVEVLRRYSSK
jgi:heme-degrading monooxygenase HmoA